MMPYSCVRTPPRPLLDVAPGLVSMLRPVRVWHERRLGRITYAFPITLSKDHRSVPLRADGAWYQAYLAHDSSMDSTSVNTTVTVNAGCGQGVWPPGHHAHAGGHYGR